jgi:DNA-binding CsgD family transcriptional regulator
MGNMSEIDAISQGRQPDNGLPEQLTPRQLDVLALMCEGLPNKLIGRRLNIASGTVKVHVAHILRALNVSSRLQAVIAARGLGFERKFGTLEATRPETVAVARPVVLRLVRDDEALRGPSDWSLEAAAG